MKCRILPLLLLALFACGCAKSPAGKDMPLPSAEQCPFVYVAAPGNYIIDIASGAEVIMDPSVQDFEVFCSPEAAREIVDAGVRSGDLPEGDWRIYRLDGAIDDLAQSQGGRFYLRRMAQVADWVTEQPALP